MFHFLITIVSCFLFLCSLSTASFVEATKSTSSFSIDLIHRDSPLSPFHNPSLTQSELRKKAALRAIARSNHLGHLVHENKLLETITIPYEDFPEYLMRFYIGTPPVERYAIADTGSDLIWLQCYPCKKCVPQDTPLFNPIKSSTFRKVSCDGQPCTLLPKNQRQCGKSGECRYVYAYVDKSYNIGNLAVEKISFDSKGGAKVVSFPKFTFGCAYENKDTGVDEIMIKNSGLVGLGAGPLSLISQLGDEIGHKFSYCFLPVGINFTGKLKFGYESTLRGKGVVSTPLIIKSSIMTYYYLNLEGISFGKKMVKTSKSKNQTDGNIVIDSGASFTILEQNFYNKFVNLVKEILGVEAEKNHPHTLNFCFRHSAEADIPDIVFHFTGAKVQVQPIGLFTLVEDNLVCMLVEPTSENGVPFFGNQAQVGYEVQYDLKGGKVSFAPSDCT